MRGREFDGSVFALSFSKSRQRFGCLALAILPVAVSTRASARSPWRPLDEMAHPSSVSPSSDLTGNRMIASTLPMIAVNRFPHLRANAAIYRIAILMPVHTHGSPRYGRNTCMHKHPRGLNDYCGPYASSLGVWRCLVARSYAKAYARRSASLHNCPTKIRLKG